MTVFYIVLALFFCLFYYGKNNDLLHPCLLFTTIWCLTSAVSCIRATTILNEWHFEMHIVVFLSIFSFFVGSLLCTHDKKKELLTRKIEIPQISLKLFYLLLFICFACYLFEVYKSGFTNINSEIESFDLKDQLYVAIPGIHYGTILLPFLAIFCIYLAYIKADHIILNYICVATISFFIVFFDASRGSLIVILLGFFFIHSRFYSISIKNVILFTCIILLSFIGIMTLRVREGYYGLVYEMLDNPYLSCFYTYIAPNYGNLNDLIQRNYEHNFIGCGSFLAFWRILGIRDYMYDQCVWIEQLGTFNARTYLYSFYYDFGYLGIIVFPFFLGLFLDWVYNKTYSFPQYIVLLACLQKAIIFCFFGNYFFGELVILFPYVIIFLLVQNMIKNLSSKNHLMVETSCCNSSKIL